MKSYESWADDAFVGLARMTPELASVMGLARLPQFADLSDRLNDYSIAAVEERSAALARVGREHLGFDRARLTPAQTLSYDVFAFLLECFPFEPWAGTAGEAFRFHAYPIRHFDGGLAEIFGAVTRSHALVQVADGERYLTRLQGLSKVIEDLCDAVQFRDARGLSPPSSALRIAIGELREWLAAGPGRCTLLTDVAQQGEPGSGMAPADRARIVRYATDLVRRLYERELPGLLAVLELMAGRAREEMGAWALPDGDAYYRHCLRRQNTTSLSPAEIYSIGQEETSRIRTELQRLLREAGSGGDLPEALEAFRSRDTARADSDSERDAIVRYYTQLLADTDRLMRPHFGRFPAASCKVVPTPRHLEAHRTSCYFPPTVGLEQPGTFELSMPFEIGRPAWARHQLAYHEAVPGHHLQLSLAQELTELPLFRRVFVVAGYIEGWAKYAERLPFETGVHVDIRAEIQRTAMELVSAGNLMLDVGIHERRWGREQAVEFASRNACVDRSMAEYLVDRISVAPGQSTAYMLGLRCMRELRESMRIARSPNFNLREFHDAVLLEGALPLDVLRQSVLRSH